MSGVEQPPVPGLPDDCASVLRASHERLCERLVELAPELSVVLLPWMRTRPAKGLAAERYFTHPLAFPLVQLPWWLEESLGAEVDRDAQAELLLSSMSGYYLIRLIDDVMDQSPDAQPRLLPSVAIFHDLFQSVYMHWFDGAHPFWPRFHAAWARCQEAAVVEAGLSEVDDEAFGRLSARKVSAAIIPMEAVAWRKGLVALPPAWAALFPKLCAFHQRHNDLFDWKRDLDSGGVTYFLSEGRRRRRVGETLFEWVAREGFALECSRLREALDELDALACEARSGGLRAWLLHRAELLDQAQAEARAGFEAAAPLLRALAASGAARPA